MICLPIGPKIGRWLALALLAGPGWAAPSFTPAQPEAIARWRAAKFGLFLHWGPVALTGREIGWSRGNPTPIDEYDTLYQKFNPTSFDADEWVKLAQAAGMKYLVLTTKHHDGFCLWDTGQTDYNILHSPFGRDVVKELSEACHRAALPFGVYYSTCDWHHPDFPLTSPAGQVERPVSHLDRYTGYLKAQTRELLGYGPLFVLWYDYPQRFDAARGAEVINFARALQPDLVINDRTGAAGDFDTPEQRIGGFQMNRPWETCMTLGTQWSWKPNDTVKSLQTCLHTLIRTAGGDGNLLFNVGPEASGLIEPRQAQRLREMGRWLEQNGESIYNTRGGPWKPSASLASTRRHEAIYLHVLKPCRRVVLPAPAMEIRSAAQLDGRPVKMRQSHGLLELSWEQEGDGIDSILKLTTAGNALDIPTMETSLPGLTARASAVFGNDPSYAAAKALDGDPATRWATPAGTAPVWFQIDFPHETWLDGLVADEVTFGAGSRVQAHTVEVKTAGQWRQVAAGQALGRGSLIPFDPVTATAVRLKVAQATNGPSFSEIQPRLCFPK